MIPYPIHYETFLAKTSQLLLTQDGNLRSEFQKIHDTTPTKAHATRYPHRWPVTQMAFICIHISSAPNETWTYVHPQLQRTVGNISLLDQVLQKAEPRIHMLMWYLRGTNSGLRVRKKWRQNKVLYCITVVDVEHVSIGMLLFSRATEKRN